MERKRKRLNDLISGELKRQKISQTKAGYYIGMSQSEFSLKVSGKAEWRLKDILGLAELLEIGGEISEILF
ncbi:MAG: hypothetical protein J5725_01530 [Bacteroidales bacterium]|nr:hypothetical protein [Bacteroidales bacterium]